MPEQTEPPQREPMTNDETDEIFNAETTRALREWGRRLYAIGAGLGTAAVMLIPTVITAVRSVGWPFHLAVTLVVSLSLPVAAAYVTVRTYGLSHHEAVCAARQGLREAAAATTTLGEHQRVEQPTEPAETDTPTVTDTENTETQ